MTIASAVMALGLEELQLMHASVLDGKCPWIPFCISQKGQIKEKWHGRSQRTRTEFWGQSREHLEAS